MPEQAADQQIRLHKQLVVEPVEAPGGEPPGREETPRRTLRHRGGETAFAEEQQCGQNDANDRDGPGSDFQAVLGLAAGMPDALR